MSLEHERTPEDQESSLYQITDSLLEKISAAPSGEPETYGATPLNHAAAYDQQYSLRLKLAELLENDILKGIPTEIVEFMKDTFVSRFVKRGTANQENYLSSLRSREEVDDTPVVQDMISRAEMGLASPSEILIVQQLLGIRSAELACLTHPYGKQIEILEDMRGSVRDHVELMGGEYYENPEVRYRVKGFVEEYHDYTKGILMTRKRIIGKMPDGTIICERSSFVLRLDDRDVIPESTLNDINEAISKIDLSTNEWQEEAVIAGNLDEILDFLLANNVFTHAIPVSTTIYAYNLETTKLVQERAAEERVQRNEALRRDIEARYPSLLDAIQTARQQREAGYRPMADIDGMIFVGPEETDPYEN